MANQRCAEVTVQITKVIVYLLVFIIVLGSGVIAKGTILFMTSQLKAERAVAYCNIELGKKSMQLWDNWYRSVLRLVKISLVGMSTSIFFLPPKKIEIQIPKDRKDTKSEINTNIPTIC